MVARAEVTVRSVMSSRGNCGPSDTCADRPPAGVRAGAVEQPTVIERDMPLGGLQQRLVGVAVKADSALAVDDS